MTGATLIDGKAVAQHRLDQVKVKTRAFVDMNGRAPCLAVILMGDNPASAVYVRNKARVCGEIGFTSVRHDLPAEAPESDLLALIDGLNKDPAVDGILVQLPLPPHVDAEKVLDLVRPDKDVDGFHPVNVGRLGAGALHRALIPCTPAGSVILAKTVRGDDLSGLEVVILGRSNIVGKPAAQLFLHENCTVTIAHSRTRDIEAVARRADILVAAVGRPGFVAGDWIKPGATVIDVGINRVPAPEKGDGKTRIIGDVDFDAARAVAGAITPVPGGVGPMTIALLMENTLTAATRHAAGT